MPNPTELLTIYEKYIVSKLILISGLIIWTSKDDNDRAQTLNLAIGPEYELLIPKTDKRGIALPVRSY